MAAEPERRPDLAESSPGDSPHQGGVPLRPVLAVAAILLLVLIAYGAYSCSQSLAQGAVFRDQVSHYPVNSVTYLSAGRTYLVHLGNGSFIALSEIESSPADRADGCIIRYRPDVSAAGQRGVFVDDCKGVDFNTMGIAIQGTAPPMQRHPVSVHGGAVTVSLKSCLAGGGGNHVEACW